MGGPVSGSLTFFMRATQGGSCAQAFESRKDLARCQELAGKKLPGLQTVTEEVPEAYYRKVEMKPGRVS